MKRSYVFSFFIMNIFNFSYNMQNLNFQQLTNLIDMMYAGAQYVTQMRKIFDDNFEQLQPSLRDFVNDFKTWSLEDKNKIHIRRNVPNNCIDNLSGFTCDQSLSSDKLMKVLKCYVFCAEQKQMFAFLNVIEYFQRKEGRF